MRLNCIWIYRIWFSFFFIRILEQDGKSSKLSKHWNDSLADLKLGPSKGTYCLRVLAQTLLKLKRINVSKLETKIHPLELELKWFTKTVVLKARHFLLNYWRKRSLAPHHHWGNEHKRNVVLQLCDLCGTVDPMIYLWKRGQENTPTHHQDITPWALWSHTLPQAKSFQKFSKCQAGV